MSEEQIETIRKGQQAFSRGDTGWALEQVADDVEWHPTGAWLGLEESYRGPEGVMEWMETLRAEFEEFEVLLEEVLSEEGDAVVVVERLRGRGRESGAAAEMTIYAVYRFNDEGKVARRDAFTSAEDALGAVG
jgi:ketosteroid isomerase-like protein